MIRLIIDTREQLPLTFAANKFDEITTKNAQKSFEELMEFKNW